jgi:hypothetical protein
MAKRRAAETDDTQAAALDIALPTEGICSEKYWRDQVEDSIKRRRKEIPSWRSNLERTYRSMKPKVRGVQREDVVTVPTDFYNTELKKGQLFFQTPFVQLTSEQPAIDGAAPYYQHVLNYLLGAKEANVKRTTEEALVDVLCPSGIGPTKIGYEAVKVKKPMQTNRMEPVTDPVTQQPVLDPMSGQPQQRLAIDPATGQPETQLVETTIWDRYYWRHFSPTDLLLQAGFLSTRYDEADWIGMQFQFDAAMEKKYGLPANSVTSAQVNLDDTVAPDADREFLAEKNGVEIWYKASVFDETVQQPELIRHLVMANKKRGGDWTVVLHENSPYQRFSDGGELTQGMRGFPIHPLTIRIVTDQAYPPSDVTMNRSQSEEISSARSMMIQQRRRNLTMRGVNRKKLGKDFVTRLESAQMQGIMPFDGPILEEDFRDLAKSAFPPENFEINRIVEADSARTWGQDPPTLNAEVHSATEVQDVAQVRGIRTASDREHVLDWFIQGVEKFASLPLIYGNHGKMVEILGEDGAARLETWNLDQISGRYAYSVKPDSSVRQDAAQERALTLQSYNLTANSPFFNQLENAKRVARSFNLDPNRVTQQPQPPPPEPDKPKISLSFKGEDLDPRAPQYTNVITLLKLSGVDGLQPQEAAPAPGSTPPQPPGGKVHAARPLEPVSQHNADLTGRLPNHQTPQGAM